MKKNWTTEDLNNSLSLLIKKKITISKIEINSKKIKNNSLFVPLEGKNFDGHQFIPEVLKKKNSYSLAEKNKLNNFKLNKFKQRLILVKNTKKSLNNLAKYSRSRFKGKIFAITGSVGKTSVKEAVKFILKKKLKIETNPGNFNNLLGMPLSLSNFKEKSNLGVLELGMNQKGEIEKLSKICKPNISLVTKISNAHIGNFKSLNDIAMEKSKIFSGMDSSGIAILNNFDPYFNFLKKRALSEGLKNFIIFGKTNECNVKLLNVNKTNNQNKIEVDAMGEKVKYSLNNLGEHWIMNSLSIISFLISIKGDLKNFSERIKNFSAIKGRGKIMNIRKSKKSFFVIDETYNSSPESLISSIQFLSTYGHSKRKICILGDMLELGRFSTKFHLNLKKVIKNSKIFRVYTIGEEMKKLYDNLPTSQSKVHSKTINELFLKIKENLKNNDVILIKGSRSLGLEKIIKKFN